MAQFTVTTGESDYRLEMKSGETSLSRLTVIPYRQRIGSSWVTMGGIAGVGTPAEHRLQGYARELLARTVQWMADEGYHWSGLFGIPNFYHRFGYVSALPEHQLSIPTRDAEAAMLRHRIRPWQESDIPGTLAIYSEQNARRTGTVERVAGQWKGFRKAVQWGSIPAVDVAVDDAGAMQGYVVYVKYADGVEVGEVGARSSSAYESLLKHLAGLAVERRAGNISAQVPRDHPFARLCARLGCSQTTTYPFSRAGMWRVLNQEALFAAISGELSARLAKAGWQEDCCLVIETELGRVHMQIDGAHIALAPRESHAYQGYRISTTQAALTQALMGFVPLREALEGALNGGASPYEELGNAGGNVSGAAPLPARADGPLPDRLARLLDVLFPLELALLWPPDRF